MDAAFERAAQTKPHLVFRLLLQPLTLGHHFLLREIGSPFLDGRDPNIYDLLTAVLVCALPHRKSRHVLRAWWLPLFFKLWAWRSRKLNAFHEYAAFKEYLEDNAIRPQTARRRGDYRESKAPSHWSALVTLMSDFNMTKEKALDVTIVESNCLIATLGDRDGTVELQSDQQRDLLAYARAEDLKALAEGRIKLN